MPGGDRVAGHRQGCEDGAGDGAGKRAHGCRSKLGQYREGIAGKRLVAGGQGKDRVAVERGMGRIDGQRDAIMGGDRQLPRLRLGQGEIGGDDGKRRIGARPGIEFGARGSSAGRRPGR